MNAKNSAALLAVLGLLSLPALSMAQEAKEPRMVATPAMSAPSDAVVLFDGKNLEQWQTEDGQPAQWKVENGVMTVSKGNIVTRKSFGDMQLHLEFASPNPPKGEGQDRGNSGVYVMDRYEVQVLDSYNNPTYIDGMLGAVYKIAPPLVNACRKPGEWQTYDIIVRAPRFDADGKKIKDANVTVLLNGVLVQDHLDVPAPTGGRENTPEQATGPILLQDHNHPVQYRNIWVREL
ncbi:DUF1080 domain-containing protein [bacterium]|nr:DUF1080 domain-containing protein [bacterium]